MSKTIKTKDGVRGVKTLDKGVNAASRMKDAFVKTKDKAEHGLYSDENSPSEYATDNVSRGADNAVHEATHQFDKQGRKAV